MTPRTRLILLNSPHNPTGIVFTPAELENDIDVRRWPEDVRNFMASTGRK